MFEVLWKMYCSVFLSPNSTEWMYVYPQQVANENKIKKSSYSQLSPCGHPATTDTPIIRTAAKSPAKTNYRRFTEINSRYYGHSLMRTLTRGPHSVRNKGSWLYLVLRTEKKGRCKLDGSVICSPLWSCTWLQFHLNVTSQSLMLVWGHFDRWKLLRKAASKGKVGSVWTLLILILCTATPPLKQINCFQGEGEAVHSVPPPKNLWRGQLQ